VITFPSGSQKLPEKGWYEIVGLAWSGQGKVTKVEVSTDGGKTWNDAEFKSPPTPMAHVRFGYMWNWDGGAHTIMSRTTDELVPSSRLSRKPRRSSKCPIRLAFGRPD
jgi:sulfane dehydrogenase subunit SoxC